MQTIIQIEPNEWVSEDLLMAVTGMKRGTITRARKSSWLLGREYKHVSEGEPKPTSECVQPQSGRRMDSGSKATIG